MRSSDAHAGFFAGRDDFLREIDDQRDAAATVAFVLGHPQEKPAEQREPAG